MKLYTIPEEDEVKLPPRVRRWLGIGCALTAFGMTCAVAPVHILLITTECSMGECEAVREATRLFWVFIALASLGAYVALTPQPLVCAAYAIAGALTATAVGWMTFPSVQKPMYSSYFDIIR